MKRVTYKSAALKILDRLPPEQSRRIRSKIAAYAADPTSLANNVLKLTGRDEYRLRVGNWRVLFVESSDTIDVLVIGPRGGVYR
jgi:mRNA interferase RelE/StbE